MTISTQICKRIYQADGQTRTWELDFPLLSEDHLQVFITSQEGTETQLTTGYEVDLTQGIVTYPTLSSQMPLLSEGQRITLLRVTPPTQVIHLTQQGVLDAAELERGYDKLTLQVQELAEKAERSIKYAPSSGRTGADADQFLTELQQQQTVALENVLQQVAQTQNSLEQSLQTEQNLRSDADVAISQQLQTLAGLLSEQNSNLSEEQTARTTTDNCLRNDLQTEMSARISADQALSNRINQLNFIQFVNALPASGESKYIYAVPQEETDLDDHPIVVLYLWNATDSEWNATGAFSTNVDPATLLSKAEAADTYQTKTQAASTYVLLSQKAAANGVATLDANGQITAGQINYATSTRVGGIKQSFDATMGTWTVITEEA